jgi:serine protease AprX
MPVPDYPTPRKSSRPFEPDILDRTVIAIPLLNAIQSEIQMIRWAEKKKPELFEQFNCAVLYDPEFPGGVKAAYSVVSDLLAEARKRVAREEIVPLFEAPKKEGTYQYSVARMDSRLRRKLLALNAYLPERPILRIVPTLFEVIIDLNVEFPDGRDEAREWVKQNVLTAKASVPGADHDEEQHIHKLKSDSSSQYVFARLEARVLQKLVELDAANAKRLAENVEKKAAGKDQGTAQAAREEVLSPRVIEIGAAFNPTRFRAIYHIWPDFRIGPCITKTVATVKADAALNSFSADGTDITWAVMDSGIDADHPHFTLHGNIDAASKLHADFTDTSDVPAGKVPALIDRYGHGTHVAGIIAGEQRADGPGGTPATMRAISRWIEGYEEGNAPKVNSHVVKLSAIRGMAPRCRLVSLKVLDDDGHGEVSNLIAAIAHIQEKNAHGRKLLIQGVNISLGYEFDPEWFACGQSPLCVEIDRLVNSGVVVVIAAGNTGYGVLSAKQRVTSAGMEMTINDPGNADLAITVGSTHRESPHTYGISFFSSKGPTGDGRPKPDLVAPGEKILSCATGQLKVEKAGKDENDQVIQCDYVEDSGTSMAAPHVSGVVAAFLSIRREFIGEPEKVKAIFVSTATDLKRNAFFQGAGLIDLMRAIQSV